MSLYGDAKELRQKRFALTKAAGEVLSKASAEKRAMSGEEQERFDKLHAEIDALQGQIEQVERQMDAEKSALRSDADGGTPPVQDGQPPRKTTPERRKEAEKAAYRAYVRQEEIPGTPEEVAEIRAIMAESRRQLGNQEKRALSASTTTSGGYAVPDSAMEQIDRALLQFSGMMQAAQVLTTASGSDLPWPTVNDTGNKGAQLDESTQAASNVDPTFGQVVLKSWMFTSKIILIPVQLLDDGAFDVEGTINDMIGERIGRIINEKATTGAGTTTFNGIVTAATAGVTAAAADALNYTTDLLGLKHSVDAAYRANGRGKWMFNDGTLLALKRMVDGLGRPLFMAGMNVGEPDRIDGDPYIINSDMAAIATGAVPILYGDFSKYKIRRVKGMMLLRLVERYADYLQVGFMAYMRADGNLVDAGTHPVKKLTMA